MKLDAEKPNFEKLSRAEQREVMGEPRPLRLDDLRADDEREEAWVPPTVLPMPHPREGIDFMWVALRTTGGHDLSVNFTQAAQNGWVPVLASDVKELTGALDNHSNHVKDGYVEIGGSLLCAMNSQKRKRRLEHFEKLNERDRRSIRHEAKTTHFAGNPFSGARASDAPQ